MIILTEKLLKVFQTQQSWFDNKKYQRENHKKIYYKLRIKNSDMLKISDIQSEIMFKFW